MNKSICLAVLSLTFLIDFSNVSSNVYAQTEPADISSLSDHDLTQIKAILSKLTLVYRNGASKSASEKQVLMVQLASFGNKAVPVLAQAIRGSGDSFEKVAALYALKYILKDAAAPYYTEALKDSSSDVRLLAIYLVSPYHSDTAFQTLKKLVDFDDDIQIRVLALAAVGDYNTSESMAIIRAKLEDKDPDISGAAKRILVKIGRGAGAKR